MTKTWEGLFYSKHVIYLVLAANYRMNGEPAGLSLHFILLAIIIGQWNKH